MVTPAPRDMREARMGKTLVIHPEQLMEGPVSWGRILRDNLLAGAIH
jgi:hypothetical protein